VTCYELDLCTNSSEEEVQEGAQARGADEDARGTSYTEQVQFKDQEMKVRLIFDAPDELAGVALEPQDFLRMYNERMPGIRLDGFEIPNAYDRAACDLADKLGGKAVILVADSDECKCLVSDVPGIDAEKIKAYIDELQRAIEEQTQVKKQEAIALQPYELPEVKPIDIDDSIRREAKDRRQQHKLAVKFSNRRK
jgi:hypothetical protein